MAVIKDYTDPTTQLPAPGAYHRIVGFTVQLFPTPGAYIIVASYASQAARTANAGPFRLIQKPLPDAALTMLVATAAFKAFVVRLYTIVKADSDYAGGTDVVDPGEA